MDSPDGSTETTVPATLRVAVLGDTHGRDANLRLATALLKSLAPIDVVLHCGDIGSASIVSLLSEWPTHYVLGNNDLNPPALQAAVTAAGGQWHGRFADLRLAGVRVALTHGDDRTVLNEAVRSGAYRLVCHGHTHRAERRTVDGVVVLNPGALHRASRYSIATVRLPELHVEHHWL